MVEYKGETSTMDTNRILFNEDFNKDFTSDSSPEGDVRDVSSGICSATTGSSHHQNTPDNECIDRRESEIQNDAGPLSKAIWSA